MRAQIVFLVTACDAGTRLTEVDFFGDTSFSWDGSDGIAYSGSPATTTISITPLSDSSPLFSTSSGRTLVVRPSSGNAIDTPVLVDPGLRLLDPEAVDVFS